MFSVKVYNPEAYDKVAKRLRERRQKKFQKAVEMAVSYIFNHTPVWSGNTLANYRFSSTRPSQSYREIEPPEEYGEVNREEAERIAWMNFARAKKDPDKPFYISNNTVYKDWRTGVEVGFSELESGNLSKRVPATGIFFGAQQYISAFLKATS